MMLDGKQIDVIAPQGIKHKVITADVLAQTRVFPKAPFEHFQTRQSFHGLRGPS